MAFLQLTLLNKSLSRFPTSKDAATNEITRVAYKNDSELLSLLGSAKVSVNDYFYSTDFFNYSAPYSIWTGGAINSGTSNTYAVSLGDASSHPGNIVFNSTSVNNSGYHFRTNRLVTPLQGGESTNFIVNPLVLTSTRGYIGFHDATGITTPTNGAFFNLKPGGGLTGVTKVSGVATSVDLASLAVNSWYRLNVEIPRGRANVATFKVFDMSGTVLSSAETSSNLPYYTQYVGQGINVFYDTSVAASQALLVCDYMDVTFKGPELGSRGGV